MSEGAARKKYDLRERTALFGEAILRLAKKIPDVTANETVIRQLTAAGTSVGANYNEADDASTDRDFCWKIGTSRKEASETKFWLRMCATAEPACKQEARDLWREANQLHLIFARIFRKMQRRIEEEEKSKKRKDKASAGNPDG